MCIYTVGSARLCSSRSLYPENGCTSSDDIVLCVCDTELCNGEAWPVTTPQTQTTQSAQTVQCYHCVNCEEQTAVTCTGEVCVEMTSEAGRPYVCL